MALGTDNLSIGIYKTADLDNLWNVLCRKFRVSPQRYEPIGLVEVPFSIDLKDFELDLFRKVKFHAVYIDETRISLDLEESLDFLNANGVLMHHLCCAGECKSAYNSALAIHVMTNEQGKVGRRQYYLAIPGINYVPRPHIVEFWRIKGKIDDVEYGRWREMIKRFDTRA